MPKMQISRRNSKLLASPSKIITSPKRNIVNLSEKIVKVGFRSCYSQGILQANILITYGDDTSKPQLVFSLTKEQKENIHDVFIKTASQARYMKCKNLTCENKAACFNNTFTRYLELYHHILITKKEDISE